MNEKKRYERPELRSEPLELGSYGDYGDAGPGGKPSPTPDPWSWLEG